MKERPIMSCIDRFQPGALIALTFALAVCSSVISCPAVAQETAAPVSVEKAEEGALRQTNLPENVAPPAAFEGSSSGEDDGAAALPRESDLDLSPAITNRPVSPVSAPSVDAAKLPHDLSPWGMFMAADWVVKSVMVGLAMASLVTWTVWLAKSLELFAAKIHARGVLKIVSGARNLTEVDGALGARRGPAALLPHAARHELQRSLGAVDHAGGQGLLQRVTSHLSRIEVQAGRRMMRGTGVLATIGSTAPFVGLFGTVWGIMNAFIGISEAHTTNLAVVAPGIAEALLATAMGLVAAIPAVIIYNVFARSIAGYRQILADVSAAVERLVSRDLDYRKVSARVVTKAAE